MAAPTLSKPIPSTVPAMKRAAPRPLPGSSDASWWPSTAAASSRRSRRIRGCASYRSILAVRRWARDLYQPALLEDELLVRCCSTSSLTPLWKSGYLQNVPSWSFVQSLYKVDGAEVRAKLERFLHKGCALRLQRELKRLVDKLRALLVPAKGRRSSRGSAPVGPTRRRAARGALPAPDATPRAAAHARSSRSSRAA